MTMTIHVEAYGHHWCYNVGFEVVFGNQYSLRVVSSSSILWTLILAPWSTVVFGQQSLASRTLWSTVAAIEIEVAI